MLWEQGFNLSQIRICHNATCVITTHKEMQHFFESARSKRTSIFGYLVIGRVKQEIMCMKARVLKKSLAEETNAWKFPFKETKSVLYGSMFVTGLEKGGGGGRDCNNLFINSDLKTTEHRFKENKFLTFYQSTFWWLF